ncbi:ankyrin repeat domain-containing protein 11 isoform X3 [Drosophila albomicans]|uniref:Ankyrin repeat domain-containing protein 11 isoform X1 n=1 Tax=Drosophila albomicans TaxID=7291 RepID=A0A6P8WVJ0_DROAB|nr:ankyrin repeat domain-containing protein 11 isoform X1 [Drosophila albomicans]XP_051860662.1 ankyrin repeat domain-containing protein 11 isoform X2 [Drosophila albomicans]XP_051860663.1 ankyrin repeat domain-containing protein 11 isoform X3 [Drosophila albomicans]
MPPPRPKGIGFNTGVTPARPSSNTPMSERQQMALLIQMTATSSTETSRAHSKKNDKKGDATTEIDEQLNATEKQLEVAEGKEKASAANDDGGGITADGKNVEPTIVQSVTSTKRSYSDVEEDFEEHAGGDDVKKKKRKDLDNAAKDVKSASLKLSSKIDKNTKQASAKNSPSATGSKSSTTVATAAANAEKEADVNKAVDIENETEGGSSEDYKSNDSLYNGGLKVPPLKIVIPQQNCSIDTDGNVLRKVAASKNAALPYVVSSNSDSIDNQQLLSTTNQQQCLSPHESPQKVNIACSSTILDDKNIKLFNDEKNLRVLRSSYRSCVTSAERSSNNSSPQMQSSSPSPASSNHANDNADIKVSYTNMTSSPIQHNQFDHDVLPNVPSPSTSSTSSSKEIISSSNADLHPRKRKIRPKNINDDSSKTPQAADTSSVTTGESHPHDYPFTNGFQMFLNIRRQVEKKWKNLYPVKPRPPQGYNDYLLTKKSYLLNKDVNTPEIEIPDAIPESMRSFYVQQEKARRELVEEHTVEREKLCLNVEQEIIRVHSKAARSLSGQIAPYSVCTFLKDDEIYNMITPEQDEKEKSARCRFNGRLLLSWLQDVDDKWEKIKESMVLRQHNEAESLHAIQVMDWNICLKQNKLCDYIFESSVDKNHVPIVHVGEDFDTLPA